MTRYIGLGLSSACSPQEQVLPVDNEPPLDAVTRGQLKARAAIAERLEQDLSQAFLDEAIAELSSAQFEPISVEIGSSNPDRPGGTDCASWESVPSASCQGASDVPAVASIDVKDAYVQSSGRGTHEESPMAEFRKRAIGLGLSEDVAQVVSLVPVPLGVGDASIDNMMSREAAA